MSVNERENKSFGPHTVTVDDKLQHIAFIMDGNGRWAQKRGLPREIGHKKGAEVFKKIIAYCGDIGIKAVTVYAFSSENWKRPQNEVNAIFRLLDKYLDDSLRELSDYNIKLNFIGDLSPFTEKFRAKIYRVQKETAHNKLILNIALNYGGRPELVNAFNLMLSDGIKVATPEIISKYLYTKDTPDPDLIVRTGGELRLSNFLLWQSAYSELYFTECLWPDMDENEVDKAVKEFYSRKRRFGSV